MSTHRAAAVAALRDWAAIATPARRAALIAAAWRAGETRVAALAEAAGVTRQTVYTDLRAEGIDPDDREDTMSISPLNIEGFTGELAAADAQWGAAMARWRAAHPDASRDEATTEGTRLVAVMDTTARYADVRGLLVREEAARVERDRLVHRADLCWEALSTASAWLAAHHAYVVAVDAAHTAIGRWCESAEAARARMWVCGSPRSEAAYRQIREAGHPALEEAVAALDPDPARTAAELRADLDARHQHRTALAAQTVQLARTAPAGV
ncbi:hypothetical protein ACIPPN_30045 [Streptomyces diastaticus]|uniref:hypothetical protein n=1 Tax=Streptomyces diastaticus TaxID=1956 RepID=UPI003813733D